MKGIKTCSASVGDCVEVIIGLPIHVLIIFFHQLFRRGEDPLTGHRNPATVVVRTGCRDFFIKLWVDGISLHPQCIMVMHLEMVHGFTRRRLPTAIGGEWNAFDSWIKRQIKLDEKQLLSIANENDDKKMQPHQDVPLLPHQHEQQQERKRKVSSDLARQRRQRQKDEESILRQQCEELQHANQDLRRTNQQLEESLHRAQKEVAIISIIQQQQQPPPPQQVQQNDDVDPFLLLLDNISVGNERDEDGFEQSDM